MSEQPVVNPDPKITETSSQHLGEPKQKNTGMILTIVVVIVFAIAAITGIWYYMNKQLGDQKAQQDAQIQQLNAKISELQNQATTITTPDTNLKSYTIIGTPMTFKYPSGWFTFACGDRNLVTADYLASTKASLGGCNSDQASQITISSSKDSSKIAKPSGNATSVTIAGIPMMRYEASDVSTGHSPTIISTKSISYFFEKGGVTYLIAYSQLKDTSGSKAFENMPDISKEFEAIVKSISFSS